MCVINNSEERTLLGCVGQQAEDRQSDEERTRRWPRAKSKRDAKRLVVGLRETVQTLEERGTQLLNRRERELHIRFDAGRPGDPKRTPSLDRILEQRRLADAGFAMHHQRAATTAAHAVQQPVEYLALAFPAEQLLS
jgi:hypothetical protein